MKPTRGITASALWAAAIICMVIGTFDSLATGQNTPALAWGIFFAIAACVPTGCAIVERLGRSQEETVEQIVEVVDALHQGRRDLSRLH